MLKYSFSLFFILICFILEAQNPEPFYDASTQKWGFHIAESRKLILPPQYDDAVVWWNDKGVVMINGKYGLVDKQGKKISPFIHDYIDVEECVVCRKGELYAEYYYEKKNDYAERKFYINEKCDCVPYAFYPCPPMVPIDSSKTPLNLKILQRAEKLYHEGRIKDALLMADKAIAADTNDGSTYYWKAIMYTQNTGAIIMENPYYLKLDLEKKQASDNKFYNNELRLLKQELDKQLISLELHDSEKKRLEKIRDSLDVYYTHEMEEADKRAPIYEQWEDETFETYTMSQNPDYKVDQLLNKALRKIPKESDSLNVAGGIYFSALAAKYYLNYTPKTEKRKIKKELIRATPRDTRKAFTCLMFNPGYALFPYQKLELNVMFGGMDFLFNDFFPLGAGVGFGYEKGFDLDMESVKMTFFVQPIGPIHGAINLLYAKNYEAGTKGFGFRPEFGFNFSGLTILYGYNFLSSSKFGDAKGNYVGMRLNLPIWRPNEFMQDWGNNLIRY